MSDCCLHGYIKAKEDAFIDYLTHREYLEFERELNKQMKMVSLIYQKYNNMVSERISEGATKIPGLTT